VFTAELAPEIANLIYYLTNTEEDELLEHLVNLGVEKVTLTLLAKHYRAS